MALVKFDTTNTQGRRGSATISVHSKGLLRLSAEAAQRTGLVPQDKVALYHEEESGDWYIGPSTTGFELRPAGPGQAKGALTFNNAAMAEEIFDSYAIPRNGTIVFKVCAESIEVDGEGNAYCIIGASAKHTPYKKRKP